MPTHVQEQKPWNPQRFDELERIPHEGCFLAQIVKFEEAFREYDKISPQPLAVEMKFAILLRCITGQLRMHINVTLKEDASYDTLRETVLQYDQASIRWTEAMALGTSRTDDGGPAPLEVDRVKGGKGKDKGKKGKVKGRDFKGSNKGKHSKSVGGKSKGKDKGKGKDYGKHGKSAVRGRGKGPYHGRKQLKRSQPEGSQVSRRLL